MLRDVQRLRDARLRLRQAEEGFVRAHGENMSRYAW